MVLLVSVVALVIVLIASIVRSVTAPATISAPSTPESMPTPSAPTVQGQPLQSFLGSMQSNSSAPAPNQTATERPRVGQLLPSDMNLSTPISGTSDPSEYVTNALREDINGNVVVEVAELPARVQEPLPPAQANELQRRSADLSNTLARLQEVNRRASQPGYSEEQALQDLAYIDQPSGAAAQPSEPRSPSAKMIPPGTLIQSVLQNELNSDVSSNYVAIVKYPIYDSSREHILVPVGSKLFGRITQGQAANQIIQRRMTLTVEGISRPDDTIIDLNSSIALDRSGAGGLQGDTNHHFWARAMGAFGFAILSIAPSATVSNGEPQSSIDDATGAAAERFGESFTPLAQQYASIVPTNVVPPATPLNVVVEFPIYVEPYAPVGRSVDFGGL